jgi:hypothetical protein
MTATHEKAAFLPLGDFTMTPRVIWISGLAVGIGLVSSGIAFLLLQLISFFTNLFFFQRLSTAPASPANAHLGFWVVLVPVAGALIIGVMARYGSERIRGHGIPEAIEAILINGSRVEPKVALLKPLSSAISIGSGGPFGAEGPIIHDRRRVRVDDRATVSPHQHRAKDPARRGRRCGNVRDICVARGGGAAWGRVAAIRVEAPKPDSRGARQRGCGSFAAVHHGPGSAVSRSIPSRVYRPPRAGRVHHRRSLGRRPVGHSHGRSVCL